MDPRPSQGQALQLAASLVPAQAASQQCLCKESRDCSSMSARDRMSDYLNKRTNLRCKHCGCEAHSAEMAHSAHTSVQVQATSSCSLPTSNLATQLPPVPD